MALAVGDAAGIGVEIAVGALSEFLRAPKRFANAGILVFGDRRCIAEAERLLNTNLRLRLVGQPLVPPAGSAVLVDTRNCDPAAVEIGKPSALVGMAALDNKRRAIEITRSGHCDAVCLMPVDSRAQCLADPKYHDDSVLAADVLGHTGTVMELNVADGIWCGRVTSHIPMREIFAALTVEAIVERLVLMDRSMRKAGIKAVRLALPTLNPHGLERGELGYEEREILVPAVNEAIKLGLSVDGPLPADSVFKRAAAGNYNGILTLYHDQGMIALKTKSFDSAVTLYAGLDVPVVTSAHGSAYEIAGRGIARPLSAIAALQMTCELARGAPVQVPARTA